MKKIGLFLTVLLASAFELFAQQDAMFSQYMFNMMLINPAYTGSRDVLSLSAMYRKQWVSVPGAPETMTLTGDSRLKNEHMGVGGTVFSDKIGVTTNTGFNGNYAYRIRLSNKSTLALGASLGLANYQANLNNVKLNDGSTSSTSDAAFSANVNKILPNLGLGLYYSSDKYYIGISLPHVLDNKINTGSGSIATQDRHSFIMAGYVFNINESVKLKPSTLIKYVSGSPIQVDLNANIWLYDKFSFGLSYRTLDAVVAMIELQVSNPLRFGYAFDYATSSQINNYSSGTHEIYLRYEFGYDRAKVLTPRYF